MIFLHNFQNRDTDNSCDTTVDVNRQYRPQQRIQMLEAYFATKSVVQTHRQYVREFGRGNVPTRRTTERLVAKFQRLGGLETRINVSVVDHRQLVPWTGFRRCGTVSRNLQESLQFQRACSRPNSAARGVVRANNQILKTDCLKGCQFLQYWQKLYIIMEQFGGKFLKISYRYQNEVENKVVFYGPPCK